VGTVRKNFMMSTLITELFIRVHEVEDLVKIKPNKKAIMKVLVGKDKELGDFINKENLDLKNEQDLAKLFAYYNPIT
jgi:hypothetical protein